MYPNGGVSPFIVPVPRRETGETVFPNTMKSRGGGGGVEEGGKNDRGRGGSHGMGFFARLLTTISIVYDFNNLGAASSSRASRHVFARKPRD